MRLAARASFSKSSHCFLASRRAEWHPSCFAARRCEPERSIYRECRRCVLPARLASFLHAVAAPLVVHLRPPLGVRPQGSSSARVPDVQTSSVRPYQCSGYEPFSSTCPIIYSDDGDDDDSDDDDDDDNNSHSSSNQHGACGEQGVSGGAVAGIVIGCCEWHSTERHKGQSTHNAQ